MQIAVYIAKITGENKTNVACEERNREIENTKNSKAKSEKYEVWKLLERAIEEVYGVNAEAVYFTKDKNGKWHCDKCEFSLSHAGGYAAVAVADFPVGIDIEKYEEEKFMRLGSRILTESEAKKYELLSKDEQGEFLIKSWTRKEAALKRKGEAALCPRENQRTDGNLYTEKILLDGKIFYLAISYKSAYNTPVNVRICK